jgi:hypothetical protein
MPFRKKTNIGELELGEIAALAVQQQRRASRQRRDGLNGRSRVGGNEC